MNQLELQVDDMRKEGEGAARRNTLALESITKVRGGANLVVGSDSLAALRLRGACMAFTGHLTPLDSAFFEIPDDAPLYQVSSEETGKLRDALAAANQQSEERFAAMAKEVENLLQKLNEAESALAEQQEKGYQQVKVRSALIGHMLGCLGC